MQQSLQNSIRPGDVVRSYSGKTIEIINTDAEGRVLLADLLSYAIETFSPRTLLDVDTLIGNAKLALGADIGAVLSNSDTAYDKIQEAADLSTENIWRLPLHKAYRTKLMSNVADLRNVGGVPAGCIMAALFLNEFVGDDTEWIHLDICSVVDGYTNAPRARQGATGWGVKTLFNFLRMSSA